MPEQSRSGGRNDGHELGNQFQQSNSPSYSGDLGHEFAEKNRSAKDHPRRKWFWILAICLLLLVIFLIHHFSGDTTGTKPARGAGAGGAATITVGQSTTGSMPVYVEALGTVTPTYTVTLYSQVTGRVLAVHYTEGQFVRKGQPLVEIDPQPYEATLQQAEGSLKHDQGVLAQAQMDLKRYQDARLAIARQQLEDQAKIVQQAEGTVQADEGAVQADKVQLAYTHIVAPIAGRVGLRLVDPGNTVFSGSSSTLVVITALQPITVVFNVSEDDLPNVQAQLKGRNVLTVDAFDRSNNVILDRGKLTSLDNQIDTTTGTVKFRATYSNSKLNLFPNQFVNARLLLKTLNNVTLVPNAAVQHNGTAAFVYVVKGDGKGGQTVAVQNVGAATNDDKNTAVTGVGPNQTLATSGFDRLDPGAKVKIAQPRQGGGRGSAANGTQNGEQGGSDAATGGSPDSTQPAGAGTAAGTANGAGNGSGQGNAGTGGTANGNGQAHGGQGRSGGSSR
jgi:multidrug efflux system membrane fusion protein